ncbi:MAG: EpsG family protein [Culicoidibacterales bacterium]
MNIFFLTLIVTFFLAFGARLFVTSKGKPNILWVLLLLIVFVGVAGLRSGIGDTGAYISKYALVVNGTLSVTTASYELGFVLFLQLLTLISTDPQIMIFTTSLIIHSCYIWMFRTYASLFELQIYMYIASGFFLTLMNGMRQGLAAAILFASTKLIVNNNFKSYLIIILLLSTVHTSVLIMIPVYFIVREEAWSKRIVKILFFSAIGLLFAQPLISILFQLLEGSKYEVYSTFNEGGSNILRTVVAAIPVVLAYIGRERLKEEWPESNVFVNMSIINLIIYSFSLVNWIFARFAYYFTPYTFVLLPYLIKTMFNKNEKPFIYYSLLVCYFIFMSIEYGGVIYRSAILGINM